MKNIFIISAIAFSCSAYGQVAIAKTTLTNTTSVLLEFYDKNASNVNDNAKGIILPYVTSSADVDTSSLASSEKGGVFIYDSSDHKVKAFSDNVWMELSDDGTIGKNSDNTSNATDGNNTNTSDDTVDSGVIIGVKDTAPKGALVLNSSDKALVLPKIKDPHTTVKSPYPGMMCYDITSKTLAVYDGAVWSYWK